VPDRVFWGVVDRDATRLDSFAAINVSVTPVYPVGEFLLGGAAANRPVDTRGRYYGSLDVGLACTVGASAGDNISAKKLTTEGMALG
jgi:filamentous hemagglutinin